MNCFFSYGTALIRRLVDPAKNRDLGFAVVQRVWTWHIDVQEMQFMFNATHRANDEDAVAAALLASHDAKGDYDAAAASKLETRRRMLELEREGVEGAFYTLVPIRPRCCGERRSLRTFALVSLRPHLTFNPRPRRLSTSTDAFQIHPDGRRRRGGGRRARGRTPRGGV